MSLELEDGIDRAILKAKSLRESHDRLVAALNRCVPLMRDEWDQFGSREPEAIALRMAIEALRAAEDL
ncbi:MAG: hypothetical protein WAN65_18540 [Candidatus Sulfotelmatobacter sp.]